MARYTRSNAWNQGGTFDNPDLLWYAKGVGAMMALPLNDRNSWWFFAAIHGQYLPGTPNQQSGFPGWQAIPPVPAVPTTPLPSGSDIKSFWDQCQHQSWYFPPWHRGYLIALEGHLRKAIIALGGPASWALPYWNYLGPDTQYEIPPAFTQATLPDGKTPNPLFVTARYGPNNNGDIFIPVPPVSGACMNNTVYTGSNADTPRPGFGGPQTGFSHDGQVSGNLENNPHNMVHVDVGGNAPNGQTWGLMADPGIAALDPVFYLHHANIDRMWAAWNAKGNANPSSAAWLKGPAAAGERPFVMPMADGSTWVYTPADVDDLGKTDYTYDDLQAAAPAAARAPLAIRLHKLGAPDMAGRASDQDKDTATASELVGSHDGSLMIRSSGARAQVKLDAGVRSKLSDSLKTASLDAPPDRAYLQLENVRGARDAQKLQVYVNEQLAGTVALFGLRRASAQNAEHAGNGLSFELDVTALIDSLYVENALATDALDVRIQPSNAVDADAPISVGRISLYRESHK